MIKILSSNTPKARKEYICDLCGEKIIKDEIYNSAVCVYDGEIYNWRSHIRCDKIARNLKMYVESYGEGIDSDIFHEYITDEYLKLKNGKIKKEMLPLFIEQLNYVCSQYLPKAKK